MSTQTETRHSAAALPDDLPTGLLINGEWIDAARRRHHRRDRPGHRRRAHPASPTPRPADAVAALDAASPRHRRNGRRPPPRKRAEILRKTFDEVTRRKDDFARLMTLEMGKPLAEAYGEVTYGSEFLRWFSEEAVRINGRYGLNPEGTGRMIVSSAPGRSGVPDHAVELPAGDGDPQDRAGAGRRLPGDHQAGRQHAADHAAARPAC